MVYGILSSSLSGNRNLVAESVLAPYMNWESVGCLEGSLVDVLGGCLEWGVLGGVRWVSGSVLGVWEGLGIVRHQPDTPSASTPTSCKSLKWFWPQDYGFQPKHWTKSD